MKPSTKFAMLLLLSLLSVFFAEVISGSMPFPLFDIWGYLVVIPLYGFHTILLYALIQRVTKNRPISFVTLYSAGMIFGLYEAYITKVLWTGLASDSLVLLELAIIDFNVLVFFWHPLFSFIIPLLVFETFMTSSRTVFIGLPNRVKKLLTSKKGVASILIVIGFFSAFNGVSPDHLLLSMLGLGLPIVLLMFVLRRRDVHLTYELSDILPNRKGLIGIGMYLAGIYVFLTFFDRFEVITWTNQLVIWVCYLFAGSLLYIALKNNKNRTPLQPSTNPHSTLAILYGGCIITISGVLFVLVFYTLGIRDVTVIITWILWNIIGITLVIYTVIQTFQKKKLD